MGHGARRWQFAPGDGSYLQFFYALQPYIPTLQACHPLPADIGLWESAGNEVFHFCLHKKLDPLLAAHRQWHVVLHDGSWRYRCVNDAQLAAQQLSALKVLIMPCPYYLTAEQARGLDAWVRAGGVLLTEAHLGGYDGTEGRHSRRVPGFGLDKEWDLTEVESTSAHHLRLVTSGSDVLHTTPDVQKALQEAGAGGRYFPLQLSDGTVALGCDRVALLAGSNLQSLATIQGLGCVAGRKKIGKGTVIYVATALGETATRDATGARWFLAHAAAIAGVTPTGEPEGVPGSVRLDILTEDNGTTVAVLANRTRDIQRVTITLPGAARGLFGGMQVCAGRQTIDLQPEEHELFISHP